MAGSTKKLASRLYQLKTGHCLTGGGGGGSTWHGRRISPQPSAGGAATRCRLGEHVFKNCPEYLEAAAKDPVSTSTSARRDRQKKDEVQQSGT